MHRQWRVRPLEPHLQQQVQPLAQRLGVHAIVSQLLLDRGLVNPAVCDRFLTPRLTDLHDPARITGICRAAERLNRAVHAGERIAIYGDYDVDGVTGSAVLWHILRHVGASVDTYVPHRVEEGYGLNCQAIARLCTDHDLIVTVDCGITAGKPARVAKDLDTDLIITDHHAFELDTLPEAYALVHPQLPPEHNSSTEASDIGCDSYPFPHLCGAGVAYKLAWQFARIHSGSKRVGPQTRRLLLDLLSLVALGTVADVVPLVDENRVLTMFGLGRIKQSGLVGLDALINAAGLVDEAIDAYHVGFVLGPRLNACGRMGHAQQAVHLLTDADPDEARELARFLTSQNEKRRSTERAIFEEAEQMIEQGDLDRSDHRAIVLGKAGWHPGVVGIVASRLVERYARPVILLCYDNGTAQGSARSVEGLSIHEALVAVASQGHLQRFGGHAMAAGLSLPTDRVKIFRDALVEFVNCRLGPNDLVHCVEIHAAISPEDCTLAVFEQIHRLSPFGRGNEQPTLVLRGVSLDAPARRIGRKGRHLSLQLRGSGVVMRAVGFGMGERAKSLPAGVALDVVFEPKISTWQGRRRPELHLVDIKEATY